MFKSLQKTGFCKKSSFVCFHVVGAQPAEMITHEEQLRKTCETARDTF